MTILRKMKWMALGYALFGAVIWAAVSWLSGYDTSWQEALGVGLLAGWSYRLGFEDMLEEINEEGPNDTGAGV